MSYIFKRKMVKSSPLSALRDVHLDLIKTFDLKKHLMADWRCDFSGLCLHSMLLSQITHYISSTLFIPGCQGPTDPLSLPFVSHPDIPLASVGDAHSVLPRKPL